MARKNEETIVISAKDKTKAEFASVKSGLRDMERQTRAFRLGLGALAGVAFVNAARTAGNFEQSIADLSAITGATGKDLKFLTEASKEFGATTTLSASQAAEAFKLVASAKPDLLESTEALKAVTAETIALAEAAGIELPDAARSLGSALNQFNAPAEDAGKFINVLAAGAKFGASEITDTAEALKSAGVVAASANISFEQTNAALQLLARGALKGGEAGTGLRGVILKLTTQTNDEFNPAIVGLEQSLKNLNKAELDAVEMKALFGERTIVAAQLLLNEADAFGVLEDKLTDTNVAYEQAAIRTATFNGSLKGLASAYEALELSLLSTNGIMKDTTDLVADSLRNWAAFFNPESELDQRYQEIRDLNVELNTLERAASSVKGGGWLNEVLHGGDSNEIQAQIEETTTKLNKLRDELSEMIKLQSSATDGQVLGDAFLPGTMDLPDEPVVDPAKADASTKAMDAYAKKIQDVNFQSGLLAEKILWLDQAMLDDTITLATYTEEFERLTGKMSDNSDQINVMAENNALLLEFERQFYTNKQALQNEYLAQKLELEAIVLEGDIEQSESAYRLLESLESRHQANMNKIVYEGLDKNQKFATAFHRGDMKNMFQFGAELTAGVANQSREMFEINKALALANAAVTLPDAILQSFQRGGGYPWGLIPAGLMLATGLAQIAQINSASYGSGGSAPSLAGTGGGGATTVNTTPVSATPTPDFDDRGAAEYTVIFEGDVYGWDEFIETKVIESLREARDRDVRI